MSLARTRRIDTNQLARWFKVAGRKGSFVTTTPHQGRREYHMLSFSGLHVPLSLAIALAEDLVIQTQSMDPIERRSVRKTKVEHLEEVKDDRESEGGGSWRWGQGGRRTERRGKRGGQGGRGQRQQEICAPASVGKVSKKTLNGGSQMWP